ncbi:hypothetical protein ACP70R_038871 [Stipagrostis hirtigluma subsp. patula]
MSPPPCPKRARCATVPCSGSKLRRLGTDGHGEDRPWASLPEGVVQLIGWRVLAGDLLDYVRFRAVCAHWNWSAVPPAGRGLLDPRFHPRRWMMLPEGHGLYPGHPNLGGYVRFFNLSTGAFVSVHLPLFHDHIVLDSTDGLLLLLLHRDQGTAIRLLHPFTGDIAELPPLSSLLPQMRRYRFMTDDSKLHMLRGFLTGVNTALTVSAAGAITVMLALDMRQLLAHATAGDQQWTLAACKLPSLLAPTVPFQGKLFAVSLKSAERNSVCIWQIDPPQPNAGEGLHSLSILPPRIIANCPLVATTSRVHLVECGSEIMLVGFDDTKYEHLVVYRLADLIRGRVVPMTNIGEHVLFLGQRPLYASPNKGLPFVVGNSIICQYRLTRNSSSQVRRHSFRCTEQYHLSSGTWSPALDGDISCWETPPVCPYMLVHHIIACCYRSY